MPTITPVPPGSPQLEPVDRHLAIQLIRGLLRGPRSDGQIPHRPVISYVQESAQVNETTWRHIYRFFVINPGGLYNISGLITLLLAPKVNDRSQTFSFSQQNAEQDRASFLQALQKILSLPDLVLEDLLSQSAEDVLDYIIPPRLAEFINNGTSNEQ